MMSKYVKHSHTMSTPCQADQVHELSATRYSEITWKLHLFLSGKGRAQESSVDPGSLSDSIALSALPNRQVHSSPRHKTTQKPHIADSFWASHHCLWLPSNPSRHVYCDLSL